jgi:para-aminobenzoate synthetase component 1
MNSPIELQITDLAFTKLQILAFTEAFEICNYYDSNEINSPLNYDRFECIAAFGCIEKVKGNFKQICHQIEIEKRWVMGYFAYELNEKLNSDANLADCENGCYIPEILLVIRRQSTVLEIINNGISDVLFEQYVEQFKKSTISPTTNHDLPLTFVACTPKSTYIENVEAIKKQIIEGDFYEINYCQKFISEGTLRQPLKTFEALNKKSPTPFAAYVKNESFTLLCTSPERFLFKDQQHLVSQPIKGTNKRLQNEENEKQIAMLKNDEKELAENVMIVDLVRNDLGHVCASGSIKVEELCEVYPFALVNQMISTVTGTLIQNSSFASIFTALFPMGSMTGAPKVEVMKNIAIYENEKRGIYSGCIGYKMPNGDFDFNVVIRTIIEDKLNNNVSFHVGGAITYDSNPEKEFEECLLKANGFYNF